MAIFNPLKRNRAQEDQTQSQPKKLTSEIGVDGDMIFNGFSREEERLDKISIKDYRKMRDTDATLDGLIKIITYPILAASYGVKPGPDDENGEQAQRIRNALFEPPHKGGMETPFSLVLDQMIHAIYEGFSLFERVYKLDDDGWMTIRKMAHRDATTLSLVRDKSGGYGGARQKAQFGDKSVDVMIPSYKTFLFTYDKASDYLYGRSILKPTYRNWDKKRKMEYFDSVAIQSKSIRPKLLKRISDALVKGAGKNTVALRMLAKLGEFKSSMSLPNGYDVTELEGGNNDNTHESIERQNSEMARAFLANFMLSGSQGSQNVGSYNLSSNQSNIFMLALKGVMNLVAEHINTYWIADLIDINYPIGNRHYPEFYFDDLTSETVDFMQQIFNTLIQKDKISNDLIVELEKQVASRFDIDTEKMNLDANAGGPDAASSEEDDGQPASKFQPADKEVEEDKPESSDTDGLDPAIVEAESNVNFAGIEKFLNKTEAGFEEIATGLLEEYMEKVADNPDDEIELPAEYIKLLETTYQSAYNYGKLSASNELGEKAPKTPKAQAERTERYVDFVVQKQTNDIREIVAEAMLKLPVEVAEGEDNGNELLKTLILAAAAVWIVQAVQGTKTTIANNGLGGGRSDTFTVLADDGDLRMWSSRMEQNTCATCSALNNTTYNAQQWAELEYKPGDVHFSCRCIEILLRANDNYDLPDPTGPPSDIDEIDHMRITTKGELQKQGLVGGTETKKAAVERKLYNQVDNGKTLKAVENATRGADVEYISAFDSKMKKIAELTDHSSNSVSLSQKFYDYFMKNDGSILTHNHPGSTSFSDADFNVAIIYNVKEMRVSSSLYTYTVSPGKNGWPDASTFLSRYGEVEETVYSKYEKWIQSGKIQAGAETQIAARNEVNSIISEEFMLKYSQEKL